MPRLKKRDMTLTDLRKYDGTGPEGRVLVAVLGKIYDVTKGKRFYGPGGPYAGFAGRDASRGLATFNVDAINDEYDDLSDLKNSELEQVNNNVSCHNNERNVSVGFSKKISKNSLKVDGEKKNRESLFTFHLGNAA